MSSPSSSTGAARAHAISYCSCAPSFAQGATTGPQGTKRTRRHPAHSTPLPPDARRASPSPPEPTPHIAPVARRAPITRTTRLGLASSRPLFRDAHAFWTQADPGPHASFAKGVPRIVELRAGASWGLGWAWVGLGVGKCGGFGDGGSRKCGGFDGVVERLATRASARAPRVSWLVVWAPDSGSAG